MVISQSAIDINQGQEKETFDILVLRLKQMADDDSEIRDFLKKLGAKETH